MYLLLINKGTPVQQILKFDTRLKMRNALNNLIFANGVEGDTYHIISTEQGFNSQITQHNFDFVIRRIH